MRIGVDARCLNWQLGGVARYLRNMLEIWPQLSHVHTFVLYFDGSVPDEGFLKNEAFECKTVEAPAWARPRRAFVEQVMLPRHLHRDRLDVFFGTWYSAPIWHGKTKTVVAAWDISYSTHPSHYSWTFRLFSFLSRLSCQRAAGVLTCSDFDARQIERHYGILGERIRVLRLATDDKFRTADDSAQDESFRRRYKLPAIFVLSMGVIFNRRHVDVIIEAFKKISLRFPDAGLAVIGRVATEPPIDVEALMKPLIDQGRGLYLPWLPEEDLVTAYRSAWYYVCFSTVDGESTMIKEALSCGTPVITSPLLAEAAGGACIVADPRDVDQVASAFAVALTDPDLRLRYAQRGVEWAGQFSWHQVARETLSFLETR